MADMRYVEDNSILKGIDARAAQVIAEVKAGRQDLKKVAGYGLLAVLLVSAVYPAGIPSVIAAYILLVAGFFLAGEWRIAAAKAGDPIARAGAMGELAVLDELERLPDVYIVLNQILVPDARSSYGYREIDYVVVGPNGIFILEAKSYNGFLAGHENDQEWSMLKIGRGGTPYTASCRNPVRQTRIYIRLLSGALKGSGVNAWLNGLVVLSQDNNLSMIDVQSVGVVQVSGLVDYLEGFRGKPVRNPSAIAEAIKGVSEGVSLAAKRH